MINLSWLDYISRPISLAEAAILLTDSKLPEKLNPKELEYLKPDIPYEMLDGLLQNHEDSGLLLNDLITAIDKKDIETGIITTTKNSQYGFKYSETKKTFINHFLTTVTIKALVQWQIKKKYHSNLSEPTIADRAETNPKIKKKKPSKEMFHLRFLRVLFKELKKSNKGKNPSKVQVYKELKRYYDRNLNLEGVGVSMVPDLIEEYYNDKNKITFEKRHTAEKKAKLTRQQRKRITFKTVRNFISKIKNE